MNSTIYAKGSDIYAAFVRGAERNYNRTTDDYSSYEDHLSKCFDGLLESVTNPEVRRSIQRKTRGNWRNANLPINLALLHHFRAGQPVETHARVYLTTDPFRVIDIPLVDWEKLKKSNPLKVL
jgi:hypothetical protein